MSDKNFVSYGDSETLMTEVAKKIKDQNAQYIDRQGINHTRLGQIFNRHDYVLSSGGSDQGKLIEVDKVNNSVQIHNIQYSGTSERNANAVKVHYGPASIINAQIGSYESSVEVEGVASIVSAKVDYSDKVLVSDGAGNLVHGTTCGGSLIVGGHSYAGGTDLEATGQFSHAEGSRNVVKSRVGHVEGHDNKLIDTTFGHVEGNNNSVLAAGFGGADTNAPKSIHIEGNHNYFSMSDSINTRQHNVDVYDGVHIEGKSNSVGVYSSLDRPDAGAAHAEGHRTTIINMPGSHVEGFKSNVSNLRNSTLLTARDDISSMYRGDSDIVKYGYSHAEGIHTKCFGHGSHTEGINTRVRSESAVAAHAEGFETNSGGVACHTEGVRTYARSEAAHAEGQRSTASGRASHAEGVDTQARFVGDHVEGCGTYADGGSSHAGGYGFEYMNHPVEARQIAAFAHGYIRSDQNTYGVLRSSGKASMAVGMASANQNVNADLNTMLASGDGSIALGQNLKTEGTAHCAVGRFNVSSMNDDTHIFTVGKGSFTGRSNAFRVAATGTYGSGAYNSSGADYAEMFEWEDNNPTNEDRRGLFVTITGSRISIADDTTDLDDILGIVSADPSVCGDVHDDQWKDMYLRDIFGAPILEEYEEEYETDEVDENGEKILAKRMQKRQVINPEYDINQSYIPRSERPEWSAVGMLGKLVMVTDGNVHAGHYVKPNAHGEATESDTRTRFYAMKRLDNNHVLVLIR